MYGTVGDDPFLTRRGDLSVSPEGILTNGAGQQILDTELNPIQVPPNRKIKITEDGRVLITPLGAQDDVEQLAGTIGLTTAENQLLKNRLMDRSELLMAVCHQLISSLRSCRDLLNCRMSVLLKSWSARSKTSAITRLISR